METVTNFARKTLKDSCGATTDDGGTNNKLQVYQHDYHGMIWHSYPNVYGLDIRYTVRCSSKGLHLAWRLPKAIGDDIKLFGFQVGIIPSFETSHLEYLAYIAFSQEKILCGYGAKTNRLAQRLVLSKAEDNLGACIIFHQVNAFGDEFITPRTSS